MKRVLLSLLLLSASFLYGADIKPADIKPSIEMPVVELKIIELPVEEINDIKTDNIVFNYYLTGVVTFEDVLRSTYFTQLGTNLNSYEFSRLGINLNSYYFTRIGNDLSILSNPIDVSYDWYNFYDNKVRPMYEFYSAKQEVFGDNIYYPDSMTYYGSWWIELAERQNKEGFTEEIRKEWIQLFKEMKPYYKK